MDGLRRKLESRGLKDVTYMVINHQGAQAQQLHSMLEQRLSASITLYRQLEHQPDVWQTLNGEKDDFLIYDRCGRLTHHLSLPYTIIGQGHIEGAIKDTYCKRICGECAHESTEIPEECKANTQPDADAAPAVEEDTGHGHNHGHHHDHGHGHHGDHHGGVGHGHDHNHGHDHGQSQSQQGVGQQGYEHDSGGSQRQQHLDLSQMQHAVQIHHMPQEAEGVLKMQKP
ncbi:selenoprotein Pa isoform X3 [Scomber scombrus]